MTTNNAVNTGLSGSTGSGSFVGSTAPTISQPNLVGTTTNNNAAAGSVGELISSVIAAASAVSLSTATAKDITSISLTAGDWDVWGNWSIITGGVSTGVIGWSSLSSATLPDSSLYTGFTNVTNNTSTTGFSIPFQRVSLGSTTNYYLSALAFFTTSTASACGGLYARRVR